MDFKFATLKERFVTSSEAIPADFPLQSQLWQLLQGRA